MRRRWRESDDAVGIRSSAAPSSSLGPTLIQLPQRDSSLPVPDPEPESVAPVATSFAGRPGAVDPGFYGFGPFGYLIRWGSGGPSLRGGDHDEL